MTLRDEIMYGAIGVTIGMLPVIVIAWVLGLSVVPAMMAMPLYLVIAIAIRRWLVRRSVSRGGGLT